MDGDGVAVVVVVALVAVAAGLPADTPAAMIERGGTPQQRVLRGSLATVAIEAPEWASGGPALLLLGEAVALTAGERALAYAA